MTTTETRTKVLIIGHSSQGGYTLGDTGVIDGYCQGGDGTPCAVVIINDKFIPIPLYALKFLRYKKVEADD